MRVLASSRTRRVSLLAVALLGAAICGAGPSGAHAFSARVPADYFGANLHDALKSSDAKRDLHFATMKREGISQVRIVMPWRMLQPNAPTLAGPGYSFSTADKVVGAAARAGLEVQAMFAQAPNWASSVSGLDALMCNTSAGIHSLAPAPSHAATFAGVTRAFAARYGPGGSFWSANPAIAPQPIRTYEIWNEEHLKGSWCPAPQPEVWARYFVESARAIRAVQPGARVIIGGMGLLGPNRSAPAYLGMDVFLSRAIAREPAIVDLASAVAIHAYPLIDGEHQQKTLDRLRTAVRAGGIPDSMPMHLNEIGWHTRGSNEAVTEAERVRGYEALTRQLPRTNCNLSGILQHAWISNQASNDRWSWVGIAHPFTGVLYPSGEAYVQGVALQRGNGSEEPPTNTLMACAGMPAPDTDGDGVRDENDYFPYDGTRDDPAGSGGPGPGPGGDDGAGACDRVKRLRSRLASVRRRLRVARSDERWDAYDRLRSTKTTVRAKLRAAKPACAEARAG